MLVMRWLEVDGWMGNGDGGEEVEKWLKWNIFLNMNIYENRKSNVEETWNVNESAKKHANNHNHY